MNREQDPSSGDQNVFYRQERISALEKFIGAATLLLATQISNLEVNIPVAAGGAALVIHSLVGDIRRRRQRQTEDQES